MTTRRKRLMAAVIAGFGFSLLGLAFSVNAAPAEKLPPCMPDKPIPAGGCMAPKDPVTPLEKLRPAPPLTVPPSGEVRPAPPLMAPPVNPSGAPGTDRPAVVKPPPTGDGDIIKPAPPMDSKMPVIKPPSGVQPRT